MPCRVAKQERKNFTNLKIRTNKIIKINKLKITAIKKKKNNSNNKCFKGDFPGGPVGKTSNTGSMVSNPGQEIEIPHAMQYDKKIKIKIKNDNNNC